MSSIYDITADTLTGEPLSLNEFQGKVLLIVNVASHCGFTGQYAALQRLYEAQEAAGMVVLGVPSNDFNQESQDGRKIREFCDAQFGITFPMAALSKVRGPEAHPFYRWAAARAGGEPRWNFHKYLVSRDGRQVQGFPARVEPDSPAMKRALDLALAAAPSAS